MRHGTDGSNAALATINPVASSYADDEITSIRRSPVLTLRPTSRGKIIGQSAAIRGVLETIDRVARSTCTVLVTGESGTGKELVVAALHDASTRRSGPLVTINCGAIPLDLVESELFGHAKGAFTGAANTRRGHVANADGGTLFLDEVGELPLSVQVKLLRLLQQREYTPVGESRAIKADVRIVAATNRDLAAEVTAGRFREDLYYRLNVIHLHLPPLRDRGSDVRLLATHFYRTCAVSSGREDLRGISPSALDAIEAHPWLGNVRALENAIERGVLLARGPFVEAEDVLGAGTSAGVVVEAVKTAAARHDPRREPETVDTGVRRKFEMPAMPAMPPNPVMPVISAMPMPAMPTAAMPMPMPAMPMPAMPLPMPATPAMHVVSSRTDDATALPPPPAAPRFENSSATAKDLAPGAVLPVVTAPLERRGSNPAFPRVLPDLGVDLFSAVESYQNNLIRQALARTGGNKNRAAQLLGLNRTTLVEMIRRRGL